MNRAKHIFIYTVLAVYVAVSIVGILAFCGIIQAPGFVTASAFIGPSLGIVAALIRAEHIFNDPEAISKLKQEHSDAERNLKEKLKEEKAEFLNEHAQAIDRIQLEQAAAKEKFAAQHLKDREADKEALAKCHRENQLLQSQLPPPRQKMSPVPGSAGTHRNQ